MSPSTVRQSITKCDDYYKVRQYIRPSISSLLQSATSVITKSDSFFYYKVRWSVITKCDKCNLKGGQLLQSVTILLQSATGITKYDDYYKVRQYKPCYCTRWFAFNGYPAGVLPYMANTGMCLRTELDTLDTNEPLLKSIKFPQIVTSILRHSNKDTRKAQAFLLDLITG